MRHHFRLKLRAIAGVTFYLALLGAAFAECPPLINGPRLDVQTPSGCRYQYFFQKQLANPADLSRPRNETSSDAERRLKTLNDWRRDTANKANTTEAGK